MKFIQYGKSFQLSIEKAKDLSDILSLDESLWTASSAPINAFRLDKGFLKFVDSDNNNRIRTDEVKAIVKWCLDTTTDISCFDDKSESINTCHIKKDSKDGAKLLTTVDYLKEQYNTDGTSTQLSHVRECINTIREKPLNGDGVVIPKSASEQKFSDYIAAAIKATGGKQDISGEIGVDLAQLETFKTAINDYLEWKKIADTDDKELLPLGKDTTADSYKVLKTYEKCLDEFFLVANYKNFDEATSSKFINPQNDLNTPCDALKTALIAKPTPSGALPLLGNLINPIFKSSLEQIKASLIFPIVGNDIEELSEENWKKIKSTFTTYDKYIASKKGGIVETLPHDSLVEWTNPIYHEKMVELTTIDKEIADRTAALSDLEKLILCKTNLIVFVNNFVNFSEFYDYNKNALFETGSAVIDGRWFNCAIKVDDANAHSAIASKSGIFTIYLDVLPNNPKEVLYKVALPATSGTRGNLNIGKRGIFFDLEGNEHDAVITKIIENPISLREAMCSPFKKIGSFLMGKIEGMSASAEKALIANVDNNTKSLPPTTQQPSNPSNMMMGLSLSVAALGSSLAFITKSLGSMDIFTIVKGFVGALLAVLAPIIIVGIIKLSKQDLSMFFEGCGWAINQRMRLTRKLRHQFTKKSKYPKKASGTPAKTFFKNIFSAIIIILDIACVIYIIKVLAVI